MIFGNRGFWEVIMGGGVLMMDISALKRRDTREFALSLRTNKRSCELSIQQNGDHRKPGKEVSAEIKYAGTLIFYYRASRVVRK